MDEKLERLEAALLLQFINDAGMEYLFEYADDFEVDVDALIDKLRAISV
ncbi:hypothetical protein [Pantoea stewartii]|uniref:Uncharacterized protein n=1 Tax=Pantoea stewartii subsp. stewartii DC283 TaxID=660596 RepID=H3RDT0_PANSE|nr:hypothetical protein [Pantoea stewartii]EHU00519.1 hypothetical protein CKS_2596 [Pantoea stewartii subsp. stewartii DC283]